MLIITLSVYYFLKPYRENQKCLKESNAFSDTFVICILHFILNFLANTTRLDVDSYPSSCVLHLPRMFFKSPLYAERRQRWSSILQGGTHDTDQRASERDIDVTRTTGRRRWASRSPERGAQSKPDNEPAGGGSAVVYVKVRPLREFALAGGNRAGPLLEGQNLSWGINHKLVPFVARRTQRCPRTLRDAPKRGETTEPKDEGGRKEKKRKTNMP